MFASPDLLSVAVEQCAESIMVTDHKGTIVYVNAQFEAITGYSTEYAIGRNLDFLRSGKTPTETFKDLWQTLKRGEAWEGDFINRRKDGSEYVEHSKISPIEWEGGLEHSSYYLAIKTDITKRKQSEQTIEKLAYFDSLTGLPNRVMLHQKLDEYVAEARAEGKHCAVLYLDLNSFKNINDTLGHDAGDLALVHASRRFESALDERGLLARLSGDEFVVLLRDSSLAHAQMTAERLQEAISDPIDLGDQKLVISASIGIAVYPLAGSTSKAMLKHADIAMYHAKCNHLGYTFYTRQLEEAVVRKVLVSEKLTTAIEEGHLRLHYQPIFELQTDTLSGVEALMRWDDPVLGSVSPSEFIPIAECRYIIEDISNWLVRQTANQYRQWLDEGFEFSGRIAINLSEQELAKPNRVDEILSILREIDVPPEVYEIELTESAFTNDKGCTQQNLNALASAGMKITIDDFGTGHSALWQLKTLKVNNLKIDNSFIPKMEKDQAVCDIVEAITAMATMLDLCVIAKGVESAHQLSLLKSIQCCYAQGYYLAKPLSAEEIALNWLNKTRAVA